MSSTSAYGVCVALTSMLESPIGRNVTRETGVERVGLYVVITSDGRIVLDTFLRMLRGVIWSSCAVLSAIAI